MNSRWLLTGAVALAASAASASWLVAAPTTPQPTKNRSLAQNPAATDEVWVVNKDNDAVVVMNRKTGAVLATVSLGTSPRNIAFNASGSKAYITNQRGNVALDKTILEFTGTEIQGSVSVVDTATRQVVQTITSGIGTEPFGIALAPNGKYLLVTNYRSDSLSVIDPATDTVVASFQYDTNLDFPPVGKTYADLDTNNDFLADFEGPRAIAIKSTSDRAYVTHERSGFVSVISLSLNGSGVPTGMSLVKGINLNKYAFDNFNNPTPVTVALSQGTSKFLDDIAITPDGTKAWVPHVLHNVNHDVNMGFQPGDFANRVYPAVSIVDLTTETFEFGPGQTDASDRLEFSWTVPALPTETVHYGLTTGQVFRREATLRATTLPALGSTYSLQIEHGRPGMPFEVYVGRQEDATPSMLGTVALILPSGTLATGNLGPSGIGTVNLAIPNLSGITGLSLYFQAKVGDGVVTPLQFTNAARAILGPASGAIPASTLPVRLGHPSRVEFSGDGSRAMVLSRGSEDITVFDASGAKPQWMEITPRRDSTPSPTQLDKNHTPFDPARVVGDKPTGMLVVDENSLNDSAGLLVNNETSRDLGILKVSYSTGVVGNPSGTLHSYIAPGSDLFTQPEIVGEEIFADASRSQTTGDFNNSCESCHFEGGEDGSVWARPNGPRSTIAMYGGIRRTGLLLWKAGRVNVGETGPMFGGENGGTGAFTDAEQEGLIAYAEKLPVPLNPNIVNGQLSADAKFGRDLFFGIDDTGLNPTFRNSNCASCHVTQFPSGDPGWFTNDQIKILDPNFDQAHQDPCIVLRDSIMGESMQNVNSGVNLFDTGGLIVDRNGDGISDVESYTPMNADADGSFTRDDPNSVLCDSLINPGTPQVFGREDAKFNVPTKMGVLFTGPYFHDHAVRDIRSMIDPLSQPFPVLNKLRNTQHDLRGTNVQQFLSSTNVDDDINAMIKFVRSL